MTPLEAELLASLKSLFEHCSMIHNRWGEGCNQKEADGAQKAGLAAIAKAEAIAAAEHLPDCPAPDGLACRCHMIANGLDAFGQVADYVRRNPDAFDPV